MSENYLNAEKMKLEILILKSHRKSVKEMIKYFPIILSEGAQRFSSLICNQNIRREKKINDGF